MLLLFALLLPAGAAAQDRDVVPPTPNCASCAEWNTPHEPLKLFGNTYYVGTNGLAALLVTSPDGHVLLDGALPESAPLIRRNIEALGFKLSDVKLIVNSHAHNDHAGGIAMLARLSGATVAASAPSARWLMAGAALEDDPQFGLNAPFPAVPRVRVLRDGEVVQVGRLALTAHFTGGHTPGGTSWSWRSCDGSTCVDVVYADSQTPISANGFRYTDSRTYSTGVQDFRKAHALFETMPCDLLVMPHPGAAQLWERVAKGTLIDAQGCKRLAVSSRVALENRLATEAAAPAPPAPPATEWWRHVQVLAHDSLKGRDTGSPGHESAARYIAQQFAAAGLTPSGTDGWFQRIPFVEVTLDQPRVQLALRTPTGSTPLVLGRDLRLTPRPATGNVDAPLVFAGYGLSLPQAGVDDLNGLDLRGKIVVHMAGVPNGLSPALQAHGSRNRWAAMRDAGAVGIIAIGSAGVWGNGAGATSSLSLADSLLDDARGQRVGGTINPALIPRLFAGSALVWDSVAARASRGDPLPTGALTTSLQATLPTHRRTLTSPNVVGIIPGTDPALRHEVVVYSAHSDHVGTFKGPVLTGDSIFNGAMDNASGAATLMETARLVAQRGGNKRTLAFVAVTAEEKGLLGSRWFAAHPSLGTSTIVANLNTDMFLPLIPLKGVFAYGYEESDLADDLDAVVRERGIAVLPDPEPQENRFVRSDQYSFIRRGIPALAFKVGYTPGTPEATIWQAWVRDHYHKLSDDTTQPVNFETAARFNAMYADLALRVANRATRPSWRAKSFFAVPLVP
ncbi:subclass B3 metallo-beta-lactamase [Gemmatimonas phototrophica]|uniref:subclass B3 metallo-beta-lactamase n=1 Tax=Gemmatimonas phototrophica TaxID=1379270 RepID=UPI0006A71B4C|nr:subclass B3 metallo-beta-lactamase [Gemmatimonas phototrophica]